MVNVLPGCQCLKNILLWGYNRRQKEKLVFGFTPDLDPTAAVKEACILRRYSRCPAQVQWRYILELLHMANRRLS